MTIFLRVTLSKNLWTKYYQENKKRQQQKKKLLKDIKIFLKEEKKKSVNMVVNVTKVSHKMKKKLTLNIEKNIIEWENYTKIYL